MGNCCAGGSKSDDETKIPRIQQSIKPVTISVSGKEDSPQNFGKNIDASKFKSEKAFALIRQYGLYKFDSSAADLRGTENLPVKQGENSDMIYQGQFLGTKMHGKGHMLNKAGDIYIAPFCDNYPQGTGAVYFANGNYFFGRLVQGDLDHGKMIYENGQVYTGDFRNGKRNGKGTLFYLDGSKYEGYFLDDLEHGNGRVTSEGVWEKGKKVQSKNSKPEEVNPSSPYIVGEKSQPNTKPASPKEQQPIGPGQQPPLQTQTKDQQLNGHAK